MALLKRAATPWKDRRRGPRAGTRRSGGLVVWGVMVLVMTGVILWILARDKGGNPLQDRGWRQTECTITRLWISDHPDAAVAFSLDAEFTYRTADGREHTGTKIWKAGRGADYLELLQIRTGILADRQDPTFSPGGVSAFCWVNPANEAEAYLVPALRPEREGVHVRNGLGLAALVYGLFAIGFGLRRAYPEDLSGRAYAALWQGLPALGFSVALAVGMTLLSLLAAKASEWISMRQWQEVPAEMIWSRESVGAKDSNLRVFYRYTVDSSRRQSSRYGILDGMGTGAGFSESHPPGTPLTVYADPARPWKVVIDRSIPWKQTCIAVFLSFFAIGIGMGRMLERFQRMPLLRLLPGQ